MIKNLDNIELWELGNTGSEASGKTWEQIKVTSNYRIRTKNLIKCPSTLNLYLSSDYHLDLLWFDENGLMISSPLASGWIKGLNGVRLDISVPSEAKLMGILIKKDNNGEITISDIGYTNFYSFEDNESSIPSNVIISNNINTIFIGEILASKMYIGSSLIWTSLNLPDNCVEIGYLESNGTLWIDTGFLFSSNSSREFKVAFLDRLSENSRGFCYGANSNSNEVLLSIIKGGYLNGFYYDSSLIENTVYNIVIDCSENAYCKVDNNTIVNVENRTPNNNPEYLFKIYGESCNSWRLYNYKIYSDTILVRDFIPVRVGQVGYMYDKISKQLFANQGTGDFILGPDKLDYIEIDYLESTGTQYIDTGITLKSNSQIKLIATDFNSGSAFGVNTSNDQYVISADSNNMYYRFFLAVGSNGGSTVGKHTYSFSGNNGYYDGSLVHTGGTPVDSTLNLYLFARNVNGDAERFGIGKINSFEIDNHTLIPCRRISDNVLGMYDTLTKTFLTNQGTGNFIAGPNK